MRNYWKLMVFVAVFYLLGISMHVQAVSIERSYAQQIVTASMQPLTGTLPLTNDLKTSNGNTRILLDGERINSSNNSGSGLLSNSYNSEQKHTIIIPIPTTWDHVKIMLIPTEWDDVEIVFVSPNKVNKIE